MKLYYNFNNPDGHLAYKLDSNNSNSNHKVIQFIKTNDKDLSLNTNGNIDSKTNQNMLFILMFINEYNPIKIKCKIRDYNMQKNSYKCINLSPTTNTTRTTNEFKTKNNTLSKQIRNESIITLNKGTIIYKWIPPNTSSNNQEKYKHKMGYFSSKGVVCKYNEQLKGIVKDFILPRNIQLFNLNDYKNIKGMVKKFLIEIWNMIDNNKIQNIKMLGEEIKLFYILCCTTGYMMTWNMQKKIIKYLNPNRTGKQIKDNEQLFEWNRKVRYNVMGTFYSDLYLDLNRASFGKYYDQLLLGYICKTYGTEGYINVNVPSLLEVRFLDNDKSTSLIPYLDEEIALCKQLSIMD